MRPVHLGQAVLDAGRGVGTPAEASGVSSGRESGVKAGDLASISAGWPIFDLNATHLQLHLGHLFRRSVGKRVSPPSLEPDSASLPTARESRHDRDQPRPPPARRPSTGWPGPISPRNRPSRSRWPPRPIVAVLLLGVGEGQTGAAADRADAAVHPVRDPRRPARRPHLAALADGGLRSAARGGACRQSCC